MGPPAFLDIVARALSARAAGTAEPDLPLTLIGQRPRFLWRNAGAADRIPADGPRWSALKEEGDSG